MSKTPKGQQTRVDGDENLSRTCRKAADDIGSLDQADQIAGRAVLTRAQARAPRVSGDLMRSLRLDSSGPGVVVASSLVYAPVIHNGWPERNIDANPFLTAALAESEATAKAAYLAEVKRDLNRVKGV